MQSRLTKLTWNAYTVSYPPLNNLFVIQCTSYIMLNNGKNCGLPLSKIFVVEQSSSFLIQAALFSLVAENRGMSFTLQNRKRNDYNHRWELKSGFLHKFLKLIQTPLKLLVDNLIFFFLNRFNHF